MSDTPTNDNREQDAILPDRRIDSQFNLTIDCNLISSRDSTLLKALQLLRNILLFQIKR